MISITICNWEKYNPNEFKVKYPHWLRLNKDILNSESLFELEPAERWVWIGLLCLACEKKSHTFTATRQWLAHRLGVSIKVFEIAIKKLCASSSLEVHSESTPSKVPSTGQDITGHNRHNITKSVSTELSADASGSGASPPEFSDPVVQEFLSRTGIKVSTQFLWLKTYEDPLWLKQEFLKILAWLDANPSKKPKSNYSRFIGSWLSRGWEWHRKNLPTNNPSLRIVSKEELGL